MSSPAGCCDGHEHDHDESVMIEPGVLDELAQLEMEFESAEIEALKHQYKLLAPIFTKRAAVISKIPEFWPRVFSASKSLDELISVQDAKLFESHLISLDVVRPEANKEDGDIRTFEITFTFSENPWLEDTKLTKRFYSASVGDKSFGLASEPVKINWKEGQDLTKGVNAKAFEYWTAKKEEVKKAGNEESGKGKGKGKEAATVETPDWEELIGEEEDKSFFLWFSWWGGSLAAAKAEAKGVPEKKEDEDSDDEDDEDYDEGEDEDEGVFPGGGDLAGYIVDDLFVNATKYLTDSLEGGDDESEFDDEQLEMLGSDEEEELLERLQGGSSTKKRKADKESSEETEPKKSNKKSKA